MKISNINFSYTSQIKNQNRLNFCALRSLTKDTFETSTIKTAVIEDVKGNKIKAAIKEEKDKTNLSDKNPKTISINIGDKKLGHAVMYDTKQKDALYLKELYTEENFARHYIGAGTELLKCAVEESKKRGYSGRITLCAENSPPPFVFYYKNNFTAAPEVSLYNAAIDYAARNNIPVEKLLPEGLLSLDMELDEKGAEALLEGERLFEERMFKTIAKTNIGGKLYEANFIESQNGDFYLQILNNSSASRKQPWSAKGEIAQSKDGAKYVRIYCIDDIYADKKVKEFAKNSIKILANNLGIENFKICEEFI